MTTIAPFANDSDSLSLGAFTIENGTDKIALYGSLDLTRDKAGLDQARTLQSVLDGIVKALEAETNLPDRLDAPAPPVEVKNPFT